MDKKCFKAAFFDMDGIVVDSMPYHFISWFEALRPYDVRVSQLLVFEMEGAKWDEVIGLAFKHAGKPSLPQETIDEIRQKRSEIFKNCLRTFVFTGIPEFVKALKSQGVLVGLVTGSSLKEAQNLLPKAFYSLFDTIVAGDMVEKAKPDPEPYLTAAKNLNIATKDCVVVENAPYGIKAAKAAGMFCCAVATSLSKDYLSQADEKFDTHEDLYKYFK
ncbi:MAG: HAD family phosphatase [Endomicrobium sp.]|jgi:HAD superfamily hydrolase (TIGR01509 family)|nr:HAD family phosphatase [Endomicrobium sp.]